MKTFKTSKGTELPLMDLRGKDYLLVAYRLVWFREDHPDWSVETSVQVDPDRKRTLARAEIRNNEGRIMATAHKVEDAQGFQDHTEKAETGAIGRALALCGYGTQFAPDLDEQERVVDAPLVTRSNTGQPQRPQPARPSAAPALSGDAGEYVVSFGKLKGQKLSMIPPEELMSYISYLERNAEATGKPLSGAAQAFVDKASAYLGELENRNLPQPLDADSFRSDADGPEPF